jgi:hypothetical protein
LTEAVQHSKALAYRFGAYAKRKRDIRLY